MHALIVLIVKGLLLILHQPERASGILGAIVFFLVGAVHGLAFLVKEFFHGLAICKNAKYEHYMAKATPASHHSLPATRSFRLIIRIRAKGAKRAKIISAP